MSVSSCNLLSVKATENKDGYSTYVQRWRVVTDSRTDGAKTVKDYVGLPRIGNTYSIAGGESDSSAAFIGRTVDLEDEKDSLKNWIVVVTFSNNPEEGSKKDPDNPPENSDPEDDPPVIRTYAINGREAYLFDRNSVLVASSAGEPFDPVQERDKTDYILSITRNVTGIDLAFNAAYRDAVNSDVFFGCDPQTVKVRTPGTFETLYKGGQKYYRETWEFHVLSGDSIGGEIADGITILDSWRVYLFDYGMSKLVGTVPNQELVRMKDLHGNDLTAPRLLNGEGGILGIGELPHAIRAAIGGFQAYRELPFAALNLPQQL